MWKLPVFAIMLASQVNCWSKEQLKVTKVIMSASGDLDERFFEQLMGDKSYLNVWNSETTRLVVTSDNPMDTLIIMEAPRLNELVLYPNVHLKHLLLRYCPLDGLVKSLRNLRALRVLKLELCQIGGTFNLAELLALQNLTTFSVESNRISEILLQPDDAIEEMDPASTLKILDLSSNVIEHFNLNVLRAFPMLNELVLARNRLVTVAGSIFLQTLEVLNVKRNLLTELDLSGCNCSSLRYVYASENKLNTFPLFGDSITDLQVLDLNYNLLAVLNVSELKKQQHLSTLMLADNVLKSFNVDDGNETMVELASLELLELSNNQIESLDLRGWQLPALQVLRAMNKPLVTIPDDLLERYPKLIRLACFCPNVDCEWIQRNVEHIRNHKYEMNVAQQGSSQLGKGYRCVTVPYVGCVLCPFRRKDSELTESVR
uniref:Leucine rich immune protein (Coil-less) n=1 Tax=Anopheles culicifacies TaxID=139723 RepID=A0A182MQZ5_9DIPT